MAKKQRWRRSRSAGEGTVPEVDVAEGDDTTGPEGVPNGATEADPEDATEADPEDDVATDEHSDPEPVVDPDDEPDDAPDEGDGAPTTDEADDELDDEADGELDDDLDEDPDEDPEDALEEDHEDALEEDHDAEQTPVVLPSAQSGRSGWLLGGRSASEIVPLQLLQAAHAKQAIGTALAMGLVAAIAGRPAREAGVVLLTVLVGQTILGWHNDIVDRQRDQAHGLTGKPLAMGRITSETVWYAIIVATLLLVPLAITTGIRAGCLYLAAVAIGMLGNVLLRTGLFSWWSWAASFALLPAYLSYGGWGGQAVGSAPETSIVVLAALLGVGIHFTRAVWGLVADHEDGWTYLPLKLGLKLGATRLLALSTLYTALVVIALAVMGARVGLSR